MKESLVSVIVPIFNAEKTLWKCVMSIIKQSYQNIEIILINDGSKDNSLELCGELKNIDNRIIVINKDNEGVSIARNLGISVAQGEFCCFVDSDDWIEKDHVKNLVITILKEEVDCVIQGYIREIGEEIRLNYLQKRKYLLKKLNDPMVVPLFSEGYIHPCWNKLFKLDIIHKHNLQFEKEIHISEDTLFCIEYLKCCRAIMCIELISYHYCDEFQDVRLSKKVYSDIFKIYEQVYEELEDMLSFFECDLRVKKEILVRTIYPQVYVSVFKILKDKSKTFHEKREILNNMLKKETNTYLLKEACKKSNNKYEKIIISLILLRQYRIIRGILRCIDKKSKLQ